MNSNLEPLRKRLKSTAYARFFSARRYDALNNHSLFSLSIASFTLIFVTLLQKYSNGCVFNPNTLELIQLLASITIATLSIVVSFASYSIRSEKMRVSGEEINILISKIEYLQSCEWNEQAIRKTKKIRSQYEVLKAKSLNHKNFEFEYGKMERKREESQPAVIDQTQKYNVSRSARIYNYVSYAPYVTISALSILLFLLSIINYIK